MGSNVSASVGATVVDVVDVVDVDVDDTDVLSTEDGKVVEDANWVSDDEHAPVTNRETTMAVTACFFTFRP